MNNYIKLSTLLLVLSFSGVLHAQNVKVIDNKGTIKKIRNNQVKTASTAPTTPLEGDVWFDTTTNISKIYDGTQWLVIDLDKVTTSGTAPTAPVIGDVWIDNSSAPNNNKIWDGTQWNSLGNGSSWALNGNAGTDPTVNFIGTTDAKDLVLKANNTEELRVKASNGQVLINQATSNSDFPLLIKANGSLHNLLAFQNTTNDTKWHVNLSGNGLNFAETNVNDYRLFLKEGGNVGIGTASPQTPLEISSNSAGLLRLTNTSSANPIAAAAYIDFRTSNATRMGYIGDGNVNSTSFNFRAEQGDVEISSKSNDISFATNNAQRAIIKSDGNVGIGTSTPTEKLEIAGGGIKLNEHYGIGFNSEKPYPAALKRDAARIYYDNNILGVDKDALVIEKTDFNHTDPDGGIVFAKRGQDNVRETQMVIRGNGDIGIGTNTPTAKLHINATDDVGLNQNPVLRIGPDTGQHIDIDGNEIGAFNNNSYSTLYLNSSGSTSNTIINENGGNVGIGTRTPSAKLTVDGGFILNSSSVGGVGIGFKPDFSATNGANENRIRFMTTGMGDGSSGYKFSWRKDDGSARIDPMVFHKNGNIGIRTNLISPSAALHVNGKVKIAGGSPGAGKVLTSDASGLASWQAVPSSADNLGNHKATQNLNLGTHKLVGNNGTKGISIDGNGKVGIGTTSPATPLEISTNTTKGNILQLTNTGSASPIAAEAYIDFRTANATRMGYIGDGSTSSTSFNFRAEQGDVDISSKTKDIKFATNNAYRAIIKSDGKVGIGTNTPAEKLEIDNGGIRLNQHYGIGFNSEKSYKAGATADAARIYYDNNALGTDRDALVIEKTDHNQNDPDGGIVFAKRGQDNVRKTQMVIKGDGKVGIGTTSPASPLEISINTSNGRLLQLTNTSSDSPTAAAAYIDFRTANATRMGYIGDGSTISTSFNFRAEQGDVDISSKTKDIKFATNNAYRAIIKSDGKVGIGTTSPQNPLEISSNSAGLLRLTNTSSASPTAAAAYIDFRTANATRMGYIGDGSTNTSSFNFRAEQGNVEISSKTKDIRFATNNAQRAIIKSDGTIGIGTDTPSEKLEIVGGGIQLNSGYGIGFFGERPLNSNPVGDGAKIYYDPRYFGSTTDALVIEKTDLTQNDPDGSIVFAKKGADKVRVTQMVIKGNGNIGIGTHTPGEKLEVCGNTKIVGKIYANSSNLSAGLTCSSDARLKKNILNYNNALQTISLLKGKQYNWRNKKFTDRGFDARIKYGFIAQEVEKVLPSLVYEDEKGFKSVDYIQVIPILTNAIQEQQTELAQIKEQNKQLLAKLEAIETENGAIKTQLSSLSEMKDELQEIKALLSSDVSEVPKK